MMPATQTQASAHQIAAARLDALAAELALLGWHTRRKSHPGMEPALLIRDTAAPGIFEDIYAVQLGSHWFYWWSRSCGADPAGAARIITQVMRPPGHRVPVSCQPPAAHAVSDLAAPDPSDADELALMAAAFPAFRIWRETIRSRIRYIAHARGLATSPVAVITSDLAELRATLTDGPRAC